MTADEMAAFFGIEKALSSYLFYTIQNVADMVQ